MKSINFIELNQSELIQLEGGKACPGYWNCYLPIIINTCIPYRK